MTDEKSSPLVPTLRFPEFSEAGEWIFNKFSKYIVLYRGSSPRPIQNYLTSDSNGVNWIKIGDTKYANNFTISKVDEKITPKGAEKSRKVNIGELILANSMSYGKTYQVEIVGCIYDGWFVLRDYETYFDKQFLLQLLNSEYMQNQYEKFSAGGIVQNISSDIVYETILPHTSREEQQKIAACLSSLDELITAHSKKLDALKKHKKGLMQQLFPAEGQTVPILRFPEFSEAGEWVEKMLNELTNYVDYRGKTPAKHESGIFLITAKNIKKGYIDYECSKEYVSFDEYEEIMKRGKPKIGDVLFTTEAPLGNVAQVDNENIALAQRVIKFRCNSASNNNFLKHYLLGDRFQKILAEKAIGSAVLGIQGKVLHKLPLIIPNIKEQQKIAACLSSLDELITAHSKKLDALKKHKKGLMQQLFPAVGED